jgi:hypothetical protein
LANVRSAERTREPHQRARKTTRSGADRSRSAAETPVVQTAAFFEELAAKHPDLRSHLGTMAELAAQREEAERNRQRPITEPPLTDAELDAIESTLLEQRGALVECEPLSPDIPAALKR